LASFKAGTMNGTTPAVPGRHGSTLSLLATCFLLTLTACASSNNPFQDGPDEADDIPRRTSSGVITAEDIAMTPSSADLREIMERFIPGFLVSGNTVTIRGMRNPLFVVDGVMYEDAGVALGLNPRDVERIEVVKDGGETALYGLRGSSGAVVITTKRR
jgi:TonB-dependent SusC/RagA subfamily outer membrane receptor